MNTDRLNEIRARYKGLEMIVAGRDVKDLLSEIDRLIKDNAELTERVERAEKRLGEAVEDMNTMALAMRESEELSEACCFACICDAQNLPDGCILPYGECPGYDRDDCFKWRDLDEQEDKNE